MHLYSLYLSYLGGQIFHLLQNLNVFDGWVQLQTPGVRMLSIVWMQYISFLKSKKFCPQGFWISDYEPVVLQIMFVTLMKEL